MYVCMCVCPEAVGGQTSSGLLAQRVATTLLLTRTLVPSTTSFLCWIKPRGNLTTFSLSYAMVLTTNISIVVNRSHLYHTNQLQLFYLLRT